MSLLPLDSVRRLIGYNPYHFWGMEHTTLAPVRSACNAVVKQYSWQTSNAAGRDDFQKALDEAELQIQKYAFYSPAPKAQEAIIPWTKYHDRRVWRTSYANADGNRVGIRLPEGYIEAIGVETFTALGEAPVLLSDSNDDGLYDTFTAEITTTETDPSKIYAYVENDERMGEPISEHWRIKPVSVTITGGKAIITGKSWLLVRPILYEDARVDSPGLDPTKDEIYQQTIEVYVRTVVTTGTTEATAQSVLYWDTDPPHGWFCCCSACAQTTYTPSQYDPAAVGVALARTGIHDSKLGVVLPAYALYNSSNGTWADVSWVNYREPDRVKVRYVAGLPLSIRGEMQYDMQLVTARLAMGELNNRICACDASNRELFRWQMDMSLTGTKPSYQISPEQLNCPLGTSRGALYAWSYICDNGILRGYAP